MDSDEAWPDPARYTRADQTIASNALYEAELEAAKKRIDESIAKVKALFDADLTNAAQFHQYLLDLAKSSVERARAGADALQKAAAAIATLYTGILGVAFSVANRPLPLRGLLSPVFLGLAVVLSTAYLAYLSPKEEDIPAPKRDQRYDFAALARTNAFIEATRKTVMRRASVLRGSVLALGMGVAFLPLPFLTFSTQAEQQRAAIEAYPWPAPPTTMANAGLQEVLYKARVDEVSRFRTTAKTSYGSSQSDTAVLVLGFVLGSLVVWLGASLPGKIGSSKSPN